MTDKHMLKYIGTGSLPGIPARNLTQAEVEKYGGVDYLCNDLTPKLYEPVEQKKATKKKAIKTDKEA